MAIAVKSVDTVTKKYVNNAGQATQSYVNGVKSTTKDWAGLTEAAAPTWAQGVQVAVTNGLFTRGVSAAGNNKWSTAAQTKGQQRYGPGVQAAGPAYQTGIQPYLAVIANLTLPPRGVKGDPGNLQRVSIISAALHAKKISG